MGHAGNYQVLLCASFLNQIGCGLLLPTLLVWTMRQLAFHHRGRGIGIWQSIFFAGQFFGPNLFTWLSLHYEAGSILSTFRMVSVLAALAAGGALVAILLGKGVHFTKYEESPNA
jgi:hypothetical protein